jgi:hypothetical protein
VLGGALGAILLLLETAYCIALQAWKVAMKACEGLCCLCVLQYARRYRPYEPPSAAADAEAAADAAAHRPWSKYSAGSSKHQQLVAKQQTAAAAADADPAAAEKAERKAKKEKKKAKAADVVEQAAAADPKLAEFLELMQPRAKAKIWSNDEVLPGQAGKGAAAMAAAVAAAAKAGIPPVLSCHAVKTVLSCHAVAQCCPLCQLVAPVSTL